MLLVFVPHPSFFFFFLMILPPPRSTLFPYTTLFRSSIGIVMTVLLSCSTTASAQSSINQTLGLLIDNKTYRSEEHTSELQSRGHLVCRLLLEKKKKYIHLVKASIQHSVAIATPYR